MVEIGMGRTARRTYELDDINIVPSRRTRSSQDVSTAWQLDAYRFEIPVVAHPTDALVSPEFAIELGRLGGLGPGKYFFVFVTILRESSHASVTLSSSHGACDQP